MPAKALADIVATRGLRFASLTGPDGEVIEAAGPRPEAALIQAARAVAASLQNAVGSGEVQDLLLDLDSGPVLLTPHGERLLVAGFDEVGSLGRVRFAVKRALSHLPSQP